MNFMKYEQSNNLFNPDTATLGKYIDNSGNEQTSSVPYPTQRLNHSDYFSVSPNTTYTFSTVKDSVRETVAFVWYTSEKAFISRTTEVKPPETTAYSLTAIAPNNAEYAIINYTTANNEVMLNRGSQPLPYEPYGDSWHDTPHYIHNTSTDTITTLPAVLYPTGTTATVGLKGNEQHTGTPTPDNPIMPQGCGDLETSGAKAGQYKIPISSNSQTETVYLGSAQSVRNIKKIVLDGTESSITYTTGNAPFRIAIEPMKYIDANSLYWICTHYQSVVNNASWALYTQLISWSLLDREGDDIVALRVRDTSISSLDDFKTFLQQQYAAGTPVTIWYILATETTGIVNEPLMKIGSYADSISGISIPTIAGANTLDVQTTVKPSEVTASFNGWHPVTSAHERESGQWT